MVTLALNGSTVSVATFWPNAAISFDCAVNASNCLRVWPLNSSNTSGNDFTPSSDWAKSNDEDPDVDVPPDVVRPVRIVPIVRDHKNALLFRFSDPLAYAPETIATVQHAIMRGIEVVFQLEEGEILGEPLPSRSQRNAILIYEAAEGGAGVLARLVEDQDALFRVVKNAIDICHFDFHHFEQEGRGSHSLRDLGDPGCVAGCYRCLLSYYNQTDHEHIDRRGERFHDLLARMARATLRTWEQKPQPPKGTASTDAVNGLATALAAHGLPPFDTRPLIIGAHSLDHVWRDHKFAIVTHDQSTAVADRLAELGIAHIVVDAGAEADDDVIDRISAILQEQGV